jgi:transposase
MIYAGIDVGKNHHEIALVSDSGERLGKSFRFTNTTEGADKMFAYIASLVPPDNQAPILFGMEATGHYWLALYARLMKENHEVVVMNPIQSDSFRDFFIRQTKTDAIDAYLLAEILRFGKYTITHLQDEKLIILRQLSRYRISMVDNCSDLKRQAITLLDQLFPEYASLFSDVFGKSSRELLLQFTTPEEILAVDTDKLAKILSKASHGRFGKKKAEQVQEKAKITFGLPYAHDAFAFQLRLILEQIQFIESKIVEIEKEIAKYLAALNTVITSIPGVGPAVGAIILSEIGDIQRFETCNKLVAFTGLDPSVHQSGQFTGTQNRMSKRGSPYLRRAIWQAAMVAAFNDPVFSAFYQKKRAEGKAHGTSLGAVARKLTFTIFAVLRDNKPYEVKC